MVSGLVLAVYVISLCIARVLNCIKYMCPLEEFIHVLA